MTAPLWRGIAEQLAQWFYNQLATGENARSAATEKPIRLKFVDVEQDARRRAARWKLGNTLQRPIPNTMCAECGKVLRIRGRRFCTDTCRLSYYGGKLPAHVTAIGARARAAKAIEDQLWREQPGWSPARDAAMKKWYKAKVLPRMRAVSAATIQKSIGAGQSSSFDIRFGRKVPHPRCYRTLAALVSVEYPY
jgi:hypothetical protein